MKLSSMKCILVWSCIVAGSSALWGEERMPVSYVRGSTWTSMSELEALHGHLGPYAVIGGKMGDFARRELGLPKHTGVRVVVECEPGPPVSCVVDGLQAATGATYGKQNIFMLPSQGLRVRVVNTQTGRGLTLRLTKAMALRLKQWAEEKVDVRERSSRTWELKNEDVFVWEAFDDR